MIALAPLVDGAHAAAADEVEDLELRQLGAQLLDGRRLPAGSAAAPLRGAEGVGEEVAGVQIIAGVVWCGVRAIVGHAAEK